MRHSLVWQRRPVQSSGARYLLAFATVAVALSFAPSTAQSQVGATLVVNVSDIDSGSPVADAEVSLPELRRAARSNRAGEARLTDLAPGAYAIHVRRLGYAAASVLFAMGRDS